MVLLVHALFLYFVRAFDFEFSNYSILCLSSQNLLYYLYYTNLQLFQYPNFYFSIQLIKII